MSTRIVFMGSPDFSLPILMALAQRFLLVGVVTQPDRPSGRGRELAPPPIKTLATELSIPFIQPRRLREPDAMQQLAAWNPDVIVVAAFGQILRSEVLNLPEHGCVNVHASLLPRWRGAAPVQAAILHGDAITGITTIRMNEGVDTGPILSQRELAITEQDTAGTLSHRLSLLGAELLMDTLPLYLRGEIHPIAQDETRATYAQLLKKDDGLLDFNLPASDLARQVRAFNPWPGTYTTWQGQVLKIHRASRVEAHDTHPGKHFTYQGLPAIGTTLGALILLEVQLAGKRSMPGEVFLRGAREWDDG